MQFVSRWSDGLAQKTSHDCRQAVAEGIVFLLGILLQCCHQDFNCVILRLYLQGYCSLPLDLFSPSHCELQPQPQILYHTFTINFRAQILWQFFLWGAQPKALLYDELNYYDYTCFEIVWYPIDHRTVLVLYLLPINHPPDTIFPHTKGEKLVPQILGHQFTV